MSLISLLLIGIRTIKVLFEDAFKERSRLGDAYRDLEGFILAFSVVREESKS